MSFSNAFSSMKMYLFWLRFHLGLFPRVKLLTHICVTRPQWVNYWIPWGLPMRKKLSPWAHGELTVSPPWAHGDHGGHGSGPKDHGSVTARRGHSSVTARSQQGHSSVTASSVWSRLSHGKVTAQSRPRSRLSHGWLWPFWSPWAHGEQSRWLIFFSWVIIYS